MIINAIFIFWIQIILKIISLSQSEVSFNFELKPISYEKAIVYFSDIDPVYDGYNGNQLY
jgi:hypothetical protein